MIGTTPIVLVVNQEPGWWPTPEQMEEAYAKAKATALSFVFRRALTPAERDRHISDLTPCHVIGEPELLED